MNDTGPIDVAQNRQVGRFTLADLVEERNGAQIWRASDTTLHREVALWLVPLDEGLAADLAQSTRTAAKVGDRRIVRILDLFTTATHIVVVTEWMAAEVLRDHLGDPLAPAEAARIAYEVSGAIESAHAQGIAHGRLRPGNILVSPDGEVRITGLGIDAVLAGIEPSADGDPVAADIHGIGSILYAGLTGRWPGVEADGVPAAPEVAGHTPPPSRLIADVPETLDDLCARTVSTIVPPRNRPRITSAGQARALLGSSLTDLTGQRRPLPGMGPEQGLPWGRILAGAAALVMALGLGFVGYRLVSADQPVAEPEPSVSPTQSASPSEATTAPKPVTYVIAEARDFDPLGNGEENPSRVAYAYDGDRATAWRTVTYYNKSLDKPGVGLLFDLGAPRSIGKVTLDLVGNGTDLQVLTSNDPGNSPQDFDLMAQATEAGEKVTLKGPTPPSARYVLVWMTGLPQVDGGWRGGVSEIRITS